MGKIISTRVVTFIACMALTSYSQATEPTKVISKIDDFTAKYNIVHSGDIVGKAERRLKNLADGSIEFSYKTDIEWLIFSDHRREDTVNTVVDGVIIPKSYKSAREGTGKDKYYHWSFDVDAQTATNLKKKKPQIKQLDWPAGLQSKLSYHLQSRFNLINNRNNFSFEVLSTSGKIGNYTYEYIGKENIMTPYGNIDAIKLKRKKPGKKQVTYVWFAPELNYLMVKLHQIESDFKQFHAELLSFEPSAN
ncbi:DUF3108 domain-containing protein [Colwelliaceae bacterium BS250]